MEEKVIHHHVDGQGGQSWMIGVLLTIIVIFLFFYFGLPAIRQSIPSTNIDIPEKIDVTVTQE